MSDVIVYIEKYLKDVSSHLSISPMVKVLEESDSTYKADIKGDNLNFLIGYKGSSLEGLQHLLALSLFNTFGEWYDLIVDINGYKAKKKEKLEDIAKSYIDRVRFFNDAVSMPPMDAYERKQVHEFVSSYSDVTSYSEGEGLERHIILKPSV